MGSVGLLGWEATAPELSSDKERLNRFKITSSVLSGSQESTEELVEVHRANKQYIAMSEPEVWNFLREHKTMIVATVTADGEPHNTPVWYAIREDRIYFRAQDYKPKIANIRRNPFVSCVVEEGQKYSELRGVTIEGKARVLDEGSLKQNALALLDDRYKNERNFKGYPEAWLKARKAERMAVVEITPIRIASWDNSNWLTRHD